VGLHLLVFGFKKREVTQQLNISPLKHRFCSRCRNNFQNFSKYF